MKSTIIGFWLFQNQRLIVPALKLWSNLYFKTNLLIFMVCVCESINRQVKFNQGNSSGSDVKKEPTSISKF